MKMEINGVQTELSVEEFVKLSEILEGKSKEEVKEVSGFEIARSLIDELLDEEEDSDSDVPERFSVGDVVMVNDCASDVGVIIKDDESDNIPLKVEYSDGSTEWCDPFELHRLEGEELAEYNRDHIEEGDIVVIIGNTNYSGNSIGDIGKVGRLFSGVGTREVLVPGGRQHGVMTKLSEMRLATEDERKQYEEAFVETVEEVAYEHPFKVGDKVRVIVPSTETPGHAWGDVRSGDVGKVVEITDGTFRVDFDAQKFWHALPAELELFDEDADLPAGTKVKGTYTENVYTIKSRDDSHDEDGYGKAYRTNTGGWLGEVQFEVLNVPLTGPTPTSTEHIIEVGDIVQVTVDSYGHTVGAIGVVKSVNGSGDPKVSAVGLVDEDFKEFRESNVKLIAKHYDRKDA